MSNISHQRDIFGVTVLTSAHPNIRRLRRQQARHTHHGNKLWNASKVLMDYLSENPIAPSCRVLEIGCGWGIASIYCAKTWQCDVTALDIDDSVFPFFKLHADLNGVKAATLCASYEQLTSRMLSHFDVIIGCDVCFWDEQEKSLLNFVRRALRAHCRVVLADPGRAPFLNLAQFAQQTLHAAFEGWAVPAPYHCSGYILDVESQR